MKIYPGAARGLAGSVLPSQLRAKMTSRNYVFTINNPTGILHPEDFGNLRYLIYQEEVGENGNYHFQGYIELTSPRRISYIKKWPGFETAHLEIRRGTQEQAIAYCRKQDETYIAGPYEFGTPSYQGERTDIKKAVKLIKEGKTDRELLEECPLEFVKYHRGLREVRRIYDEPTIETPDIVLTTWQQQVLEILNNAPVRRQIIWIWSQESGMGKSTFRDYVQSLHPTGFLNGTDKIADTLYAYEKHNIVWFDIPRQQPLDASITSQLERLSDGGLLMSSKYESRQKLVRAHIVVTTNRPPPHDKLPRRLVEIYAQLENVFL